MTVKLKELKLMKKLNKKKRLSHLNNNKVRVQVNN
jgi:hypothetical protein